MFSYNNEKWDNDILDECSCVVMSDCISSVSLVNVEMTELSHGTVDCMALCY